MKRKTDNTKEKLIDYGQPEKQNNRKRFAAQRYKIKQVLRSMLPMEDEYRPLKEEQSLFR